MTLALITQKRESECRKIRVDFSLFIWALYCLPDLRQETFAGGQLKVKILGDGLPDVAKRLTRTQLDGAGSFAVNNQRRVFARVVRARVGWIVAMVCRDHYQIVFAH